MENYMTSETREKPMTKTRSLVYCALFTALIAVGAFIKIPIPVVPFTLQYLFTMLGGIGYVFKPSFGYIIGFCVGTFVTGWLVEHMKKKTIVHYLIANLAGLFFVYALGMIYYYVICNYVIDTPIAVGPLFLYCFVLAVPGDICLSILGAVIGRRVRPFLKKEI